MLKIHYHSDCFFFAGCENMLANFFNSEDFRQSHKISFSYRQSEAYTEGFRQRVERDLPVYPIKLPELSAIKILPDWSPPWSRRAVSLLLRFLLTGPILVYDVVVLFRLFKELNPDVLHINNGGYPAALSARTAAIAGKLAGIPKIVMVVNNMAGEYRGVSRWLNYPVDRLVVSSVDRFVTGSKAASARLRSLLDLPEDKALSIHNGIALRGTTEDVATTRRRLQLDNFEGVIFGVVALLIPRKGHQVLLSSVLKLVEENNRLEGKELKILIEGSGPLRQELVDFVNEHNLARWVMFVGEEKNIVDFMSALDVLILPSIREEDFPNVILEAMALGKPVIATRLAGTPEQVIDGETGILVEPHNVVQLGEAICYLMGNPRGRDEMGRAALNRFNNHFTSAIALDNYTNMYMKLFNSRT